MNARARTCDYYSFAMALWKNIVESGSWEGIVGGWRSRGNRTDVVRVYEKEQERRPAVRGANGPTDMELLICESLPGAGRLERPPPSNSPWPVRYALLHNPGVPAHRSITLRCSRSIHHNTTSSSKNKEAMEGDIACISRFYPRVLLYRCLFHSETEVKVFPILPNC